jgi:two-component system, cell cycle sensor histidine kinase and response regulator CckA
MEVELPIDEAERLRRLRDYRVLDTDSEPVFDRMVQLIAALFEVPIALISFIDEERQWFKAAHGLNLPYTSRAIAFCSHTILGDEVAVVRDATRDPRFRDNPLVTAEPSICFYAGAPLRTKSGHNVGSVAIIDRKPRDLDPAGRRALGDFAALVIEILEMRRGSATREARMLTELVDNCRELIGIADHRGRPIYLNPAGCAMVGLEDISLLNELQIADFVYEADRERLYEEVIPRVLKHERWHGELRLCRLRDGAPIEMELAAFPILEQGPEDPSALAVVARPIGPLRELERRLRQSQKLEALGRLAGGVAHDFNNLLTVIGVCDQVLLRALAPDHPNRRDAEDIDRAVQQATALTRQLLSFSRRDILRARAVHVEEFVRDAVGLLRRLAGKNVAIELSTASDIPAIRIDPASLHQILVNLVANAKDAIEERGRIWIDVKPTTGSDGVLLSVRDDGKGMDPELQARIFEPFLTTKEGDEGTGLGLATVQSIVAEAGGEIGVESKPGAGTTMRIRFPAWHAEQEPAASAPSPPVELPATIVVVEDERALREVVRRALEAAGHSVLVASSAADALSLADEVELPIDLLLAEVILPDMSGPELFDRFRGQHPDTKVLYMSGYASDALLRQHLSRSDAPLIQKPFNLEDLVRRIREIVGQP